MKAVRIHEFGGSGSSSLRRRPRSAAAQGSGAGPGESLRHESSRYLGAQGTARREAAAHSGQRHRGRDRRSRRVCHRIQAGPAGACWRPCTSAITVRSASPDLQNQCREFTVLGNGVDGGNCELIAVPAVNVIPIPDQPGFQPGGQRSPGVPDRLAHAGRAARRFVRDRPFWCWERVPASALPPFRLPSCSTARVITTAGDEHKAGKGAGAGRRLRHQSLPAENFRRSAEDHQQRRRGHRGRARRRRHLG